jgi:hypothetical protein
MTQVPQSHGAGGEDPRTGFYAGALGLLASSDISFLVGGTFAFARYTEIQRETKDLDIFVRRSDCTRTLQVFEASGYRTELLYPHWLAKVRRGEDFMDVVFASGNGVTVVDDEWFTHAAESEVLGLRLRLCPLEEMIWSKAFVQERERFDGADVLHLLREAGKGLDWPRLLARFGDHWPVLLSHLVLFGFVYPDRRDCVPPAVVDALTKRLAEQKQEPANRACFGTLLSREQYLHDLASGYVDARLQPLGSMTSDDLKIWTDAIGKKT